MIVIPMAGMSSRFFKAGYKKPKYQLDAHGISLFEHSILSFKKYFTTETFLFIVKDTFNTIDFVKSKAELLGIEEYYISVLLRDTRGQAESVAKGLEILADKGVNKNESITIFNIDTFRPEFEFPDLNKMGDGYLEVFEGEGDNWSFAKPKALNSTEVIETAEKEQISSLCSTGLYYFKDLKSYFEAFRSYSLKPKCEWIKGELYIAPLYNEMIKKGLKVHYDLIDKSEVIFCGTPDEYANFKKNSI